MTAMTAAENVSAARYVLRRLKTHGAEVLFGIPGLHVRRCFRRHLLRASR